MSIFINWRIFVKHPRRYVLGPLALLSLNQFEFTVLEKLEL